MTMNQLCTCAILIYIRTCQNTYGVMYAEAIMNKKEFLTNINDKNVIVNSEM